MSARAHAPRLTREQRTDEILRAARDLFCEKGYDATAMAEIAARVGVVEGALYKYFPTKHQLLMQVLAHWYEQMFGDYRRELAATLGARARLQRLICRHLQSVHEQPQLCRLMFREARGDERYRGSTLHALNRRYTQMLLGVVEQGIASGEFRADLSPTLLRDLIYGGIEHHAWDYICGRGHLDVARTAEQIGAVICEGIGR